MVLKEILSTAAMIAIMAGSAFAGVDSKGNKIITPKTKSQAGISYESVDTDFETLDIKGVNATIVTPFGGFGFFGQKWDGEQAINPWFSNIVINGNEDRKAYPKLSGDLLAYGVGYGIEKIFSQDYSLKFGGKYYKIDGSTDVKLDTPGAMARDGRGFELYVGLKNIVEGYGFDVNYSELYLEEDARFYPGRSKEKIGSEDIEVSFTLPLVDKKWSFSPSLKISKKSSDVKYFDGFPGAMLIERDVTGITKEIGLNIRRYNDFWLKDYWEIGGSILTGNVPHEFGKGNANGFSIGIEKGFGHLGEGNFLEPEARLYFRYSQTNSNSHDIYSLQDSATGIPIDIFFDENRNNKVVELGYEKTGSWGIDLSYIDSDKSGSTNVYIPMFDVTKPISSGELEEKIYSIDVTKQFRDWKVGISASYESEFGGKLGNLSVSKSF